LRADTAGTLEVVLRLRWLVLIALAGLLAASSAYALSGTSGGPLTGKWSGMLTYSGQPSEHMVITVGPNENGGSWSLGAKCHGQLTLQSISNGYHHYTRHLAAGSTCNDAGDIDCLKPAIGANIYDSVTPYGSGQWSYTGTLHRVK
jgi:hypothetical protein